MKPKAVVRNPGTSNMLIEVWPMDRPKDYPKNARRWSGQAVEKSGCLDPRVRLATASGG
jgi:hypothetical protein